MTYKSFHLFTSLPTTIAFSLALFACRGDKDTGSTIETETETSTETETETGPGTEFSSESMGYNDCAPTDGWAIRFQVGVSSDSCDEEITDDHLLIHMYPYPIEPGVDYEFDGSMGGVGFAVIRKDEGNEINLATGGRVRLEWTGSENGAADWVEGLEYSGFYHFIFEDESEMSGEFNGVFCAGDIMCG